ncbi:MAG TPA: SprT-like domain-containing protein [Chitinophagaceae bacterium]|nr:SprT-like domain-containing protein [Chitinophagaceae bacterium]
MAAVKEHPMHALATFLPEGSFENVVHYLHQHKVHLTVTRERKSVLGDYRNAVHGKNHRITVNGNLNKYAFLITLLHELAHLLTHEQYGHRVAAHGKEWKKLYAQLLADFIEKKIFPADIENELRRSLTNPAASSCAEESLMRVLRTYDERKKELCFIEELPAGTFFKIKDGRIFQKGEKLRKRFKCKEKNTGHVYLFSPIYEVKPVNIDC